MTHEEKMAAVAELLSTFTPEQIAAVVPSAASASTAPVAGLAAESVKWPEEVTFKGATPKSGRRVVFQAYDGTTRKSGKRLDGPTRFQVVMSSRDTSKGERDAYAPFAPAWTYQITTSDPHEFIAEVNATIAALEAGRDAVVKALESATETATGKAKPRARKSSKATK